VGDVSMPSAQAKRRSFCPTGEQQQLNAISSALTASFRVKFSSANIYKERKRVSFWGTFPYVCPEPVLANTQF
jgi:hypothetical protein